MWYLSTDKYSYDVKERTGELNCPLFNKYTGLYVYHCCAHPRVELYIVWCDSERRRNVNPKGFNVTINDPQQRSINLMRVSLHKVSDLLMPSIYIHIIFNSVHKPHHRIFLKQVEFALI